jgi:hypothetical protein
MKYLDKFCGNSVSVGQVLHFQIICDTAISVSYDKLSDIITIKVSQVCESIGLLLSFIVT